MKKKSLSCEQIDKQELVEQYVAGKLSASLRVAFEQHISHCEIHARAVLFERSIKRGVRAYARDELKKRINILSGHGESEGVRTMILRFAAIFLAVILIPILLIYVLYEPKSTQLAQHLEMDSSQVTTEPMEKAIDKKVLHERGEEKRVVRSVPEIIAEQKA